MGWVLSIAGNSDHHWIQALGVSVLESKDRHHASSEVKLSAIFPGE